jgi:hypothetical protein
MMLVAKSSTTKVECVVTFVFLVTFGETRVVRGKKDSWVQAALKEICFDLCFHELCCSALLALEPM